MRVLVTLIIAFLNLKLFNATGIAIIHPKKDAAPVDNVHTNKDSKITPLNSPKLLYKVFIAFIINTTYFFALGINRDSPYLSFPNSPISF
ncbi:hypothetical protein GCM10008905_21240 [Clostridium malenominatum]|uniref:Uncharacterized protein n=1 Tax=Clostridium malenominatum TaxID=1539 RepID=A0ABN1J141_9CLOT